METLARLLLGYCLLGLLPAIFVITKIADKKTRRTAGFWIVILIEIVLGPISLWDATINRGEWFEKWKGIVDRCQ